MRRLFCLTVRCEKYPCAKFNVQASFTARNVTECSKRSLDLPATIEHTPRYSQGRLRADDIIVVLTRVVVVFQRAWVWEAARWAGGMAGWCMGGAVCVALLAAAARRSRRALLLLCVSTTVAGSQGHKWELVLALRAKTCRLCFDSGSQNLQGEPKSVVKARVGDGKYYAEPQWKSALTKIPGLISIRVQCFR